MANFKNEGGGSNRLPPSFVDNGRKHTVDHVTPENRQDVLIEGDVWTVSLCSADTVTEMHQVRIPRTREFPDCIIHHEVIYCVYDTTAKPRPIYVEALVAHSIPRKEIEK